METSKGKYIITGRSRLTGLRDAICKPMDYEEAERLLEREKNYCRQRKKPAFTHLKIERVQPLQLRINF